MISPNLYVRIQKRRISIQDLKSGQSVVDESERAVAAFSHPRVIINSFEVARLLVGELIKTLSEKQSFSIIRPKILVQVTEQLDGGLSEIEKRPLRDLFEHFGRDVLLVDHSREMTVAEAGNILSPRK